jgi:hypothetical protein
MRLIHLQSTELVYAARRFQDDGLAAWATVSQHSTRTCDAPADRPRVALRSPDRAVGYGVDGRNTGVSKRSTVPRALSVSANTS